MLLTAFARIAADTPDPVTRILTREAHPPFVERHHRLHQLGADDIRNHARAFLDFLRHDTAPQGMGHVDFLSLKNDISGFLNRHNLLPAEHLAHALDTLENPDGDEIWRDYCLQALPALLSANGIRARDRQRARTLLDSLTRGEAPRLTGTSLLSALRMLDEGPADLAPPAETLARRAFDSARDPEAPLIDRVPALQVAALLEAPGVFDFAAEHANTLQDGSPDMLHVSALAALGYSRDPAHIPLLESYRFSPDIRVRAAARGALQRLQS